VKRVLVACYGGAHVAAALPVYRELQACGFEPVMLALTTAADVARQQGIPVVRFLDHVDIEDPAIARWGAYLGEFHHRDGIGISREESTAYLGASMANLVDEIGEEAALARYRGSGLNALLPVATLRRILQAERIDAVIATDSPRAERAALNAAAQLGLPSLCLLTSFPHIGLDYLKRSDNGRVMCVLNKRIRDQLIAAGRRPDSVIVTGNPAFDALVGPDAAARRDMLRQRDGLLKQDWAVLWAEQPEPADPSLPARMREVLAEACAAQGWRLVVRLHPSSQAGTTVSLPAHVLVSPRQETVRDALLKCDAVVTFTSTIGFEALVLDKPVVIAAVSQYSDFVDYREDDGVRLVNSLAAVEGALLGFFRNDDLARQLASRRAAMPRSGDAAHSIVQCLAHQARTPASQTTGPA
jgi:hypothetical protein